MAGDVARDDSEDGSWEARRVLPWYNVRLAKVASLCQIITGLFIVLLGGIALIVEAFTSVGATGILTGVTMVVSGIVGNLTTTKFAKEMWIVSVAMVGSVASMVLDMALIGAAVTGLHKERQREGIVSSSVPTREALAVCELVLGACGVVIAAHSVYFCCAALFYACCKVSSPVKYIANYMTERHQPNNTSTDSRNTMSLDNVTPQHEVTPPETTDNTRY